MAGISLSDLTFDPLKNVDLATRLDTDQPSVGEAMQARPVGAAVRAAHGLNTDAVARHNALAQKMQLPMGTVRRKFSEAQQQDMIRRIEARPELAAFAATSPERAALYIDDPDAWDVVWERVTNMWKAVVQAWDIGKHNQQFAALGKEFMDAPEDKLEELRGRMAAHRKERQTFIPVDSYADEIALTTAVEQLPRMADMLPTQAGAAALAGLGGAAAGSVVPGLGTVTAATASARAGWLAATAYTVFEDERDITIADFALLQDEDGQYMSRDDVVGAATIYAAGAAAIETAGDAFFLSLAKPFLGSLAEKIAPKAFVKTAVQRAMMNKSTRAAVLDIAKKIGQIALVEGGEESLQGLLQDVMQVWAQAVSDEHGNTNFGPQTVFKTETVKNVVQNFGAGFGAGLWLGGVPMITLGAQDVVAAHRAGLWADEQKALHAEVEATKVKAASPELTQAVLEEGPRLEGNAVIPADALMELHQQDTLILPALGMEEKAVQQAADMGQELTVPLARLHASLDQKQADAVLDIAREEPQAMNAVEARRLTDRLRTMGERAIAETAGRTEELRARDIEVERLREEMTRAVDSVPGLRARLESGEGLQGEAGGVAQFVEDNLRVAVGMARYLADETGRPLAEFLRPITYEGLDVNSRGQLVPMYKIREEMESEEERARAEADRPFWELVWGRVDPESLKRDFPEARRELAKKHGYGLFSRKGEGIAVDELADILKNAGWLEQDADSSTLVEMLKSKKRPRARRAAKAEPALRQTEWEPQASIEAVRAQYENTDEWMKAPNGKPTNLTERQWLQVRTPEFKAWFGDWENDPENASKVLDENGEPRVVYHGSPIEDIEVFLNQSEIEGGERGFRGTGSAGLYFSPRRGYAERYTAANLAAGTQGGRVYELFLNIRNPATAQEAGLSRVDQISQEQAQEIQGKGIDGIMHEHKKRPEYVVFDSRQVKSATANVGTFDPANPNILYQFIGEEGAARLDEADEASTRLDNLDVARQMEEAGKDAAAIKMATGWERGADGKWRYEIDDSQVQVFPDGDRTWRQSDPAYARYYELNDAYGNREFTPEEEAELDALEERHDAFNEVRKHFQRALDEGKLKLKDILGADEIFAAYPEIAELPVRFGELSGSTLGAYTGEAILLNERLFGRVSTAAQLKPILLHEVQHAIQDQEGFARGGSPANMWIGQARKHTAKVYEELRKPLSLEEYARQAWRTDKITDELRADYQDYLKTATSRQADRAAQEGAAREAYRRLGGEAEARNTASRMTMTYEERLASLASSTEDVARKDQIFLRDALGRAMAMGEGRAKGVTRGETVFTPSAMGMDYVVRLFKHANLSTLAHESSHVFFLQMKQLVDEGQASPRMQADYAALCRWVGSKDGFLNRDQHEKLAKGMELFLREGKAPSKKLEGAFGRFRRWLTEVYKAITGPYFQDEKGRQITLNPEVREVFSRILATQEEVARQAADEVIGRDFSAELDKLGVTGAQRVAITGLVKEAKDMAETRLHEAREAGRKAMQAKWKKEAEAQVAEERIYKARKAMRNSGMNMLALASAVGNEAAGEFFRKLPGIKREGANPWAFAASFGYDSVDQMVQEMLSTPSKAERVEQLVAEKQAEHDKQFKAQSLIASEQAAAMEEMVQEHIINAMGGKERGVALAQIKQAAREYLGGLPMDQAVNSGKFRYQAVRLMHMEREAIMAQDYARAMDINFKLRLNMELTRQSQELRDKTLGLVRRAQKFTASKIHDPVCRYAVAFLAMKVNLLAESKMIARTAQDKDLDMVKAWAAEATDYGYTYEMDHELWYGQLNPWQQMGVGQFDRVYRQLTQIMTIEQNMRKMDTWQGQQELASVAADLANHILDKDPTRQKIGVEGDSPKVHKLKKFFNVLQVTVPTRLRLWDDDKPLGRAWQLIMRPMQEARADELRRFEKAAAQIRAIINETYSHEELMAMKDKQYDDFMGESVSKEKRLLVLLNLGNVGNKNRLMEGFRDVRKGTKWTQAHIDAMIAPLEKKDYDFAQKVWDHFEQYKKERFDQEEALTGVRPLEVEATPLKTRFGTYRGGYFPIKYDKDRGARAASYDKTNKSVNKMLPTVAHGAMKDRQDKGLGSPLKLTFSVITDAVAESVHDLAYRRPVIEVAKLLRQHDVQRAMEDTQGAMVYEQMWAWLNDLAGERPAQNSLDNVASWARSRMALFAMGFKVTTMLAQVSGLLATTTQIGWKWTMCGVQDTFKHGLPWRTQAAWVDTQARSVMMKNRLQSFDRDVLALTQDLTEAGSSNKFLDPLFKADDWVKKHAFTITGWVQLWAADIPTWRGAFLKGMEELGMDEKEAALYADTMVETAQGSGATKDLSEIMRGDGMTQLLTVFFSYFNALYNMFYRSGAMTLRHKDMPHFVHLASMALVLWFVEPAITAWLTNKGPDDDEEWWEWWLKEGLQQPFQMIVGVRDISNMLWNYIDGKFGQGYRFSPAADVIEAFGKTAIDLHRMVDNAGEDYEATKKAAKRLARDVGMISGTPLLGAQMQTTLGNMWDWLDGSEEFNLRDLFFTRKK